MASDSYITFSNQDDWYLFDPAGDALSDYQEDLSIASSVGSILYLDGAGGIDTFADTHWGVR